MFKNKLVFLVIVVLAFANLVSAQEPCSKYFDYGSISFDLSLDNDQYRGGDSIKIKGSIMNKNAYPISNANVLIDIYRKESNYDDILIDQFYIRDIDNNNEIFNISLTQVGNVGIIYSQKIPENLAAGKYYLKPRILWAKNAIISGGAPLFFDVLNSGVEGNIFANGTLNDSKMNLRRQYHRVDIAKNTLKFDVYNPMNEVASINIKTEVFVNSPYNEDNLIKTIEDKVDLKVNSNKRVSVNLDLRDPGYYTIRNTAVGKGLKEIFEFNILYNGEGIPAKLNFAALNDFPLQSGRDYRIFLCYNLQSLSHPFKGKIVYKLIDKNNKIITNGEINEFELTSKNLALNKSFTVLKDYSKVYLEISLINEKGFSVQEISLEYNCNHIANPDKFDITVNGEEVKVKPINKCGDNVESDFIIQIVDINDNLIFAKQFFGKEFKEKIKFEGGEEYKIIAKSGKIMSVKEYGYEKKFDIWYILIGLMIIGGLVSLAYYLNKKKKAGNMIVVLVLFGVFFSMVAVDIVKADSCLCYAGHYCGPYSEPYSHYVSNGELTILAKALSFSSYDNNCNTSIRRVWFNIWKGSLSNHGDFITSIPGQPLPTPSYPNFSGTVDCLLPGGYVVCSAIEDDAWDSSGSYPNYANKCDTTYILNVTQAMSDQMCGTGASQKKNYYRCDVTPNPDRCIFVDQYYSKYECETATGVKCYEEDRHCNYECPQGDARATYYKCDKWTDSCQVADLYRSVGECTILEGEQCYFSRTCNDECAPVKKTNYYHCNNYGNCWYAGEFNSTTECRDKVGTECYLESNCQGKCSSGSTVDDYWYCHSNGYCYSAGEYSSVSACANAWNVSTCYTSKSTCDTSCGSSGGGSSSTYYGCNDSSGNCSTFVGSLTACNLFYDSCWNTLAQCNSNCGSGGGGSGGGSGGGFTYYYCNTSGACVGGVYSDIDTCAGANYVQCFFDSDCNGTCSGGGGSTQKYTCDPSTGDCLLSTSGSYTDLNLCNWNCDALTRYACNSSTGDCYESTSGSYTDSEYCDAECDINITQRYRCNTDTGNCYGSIYGSYTNINTCNTNCNADTSGYICNTSTGNCSYTTSGAQYGTLSQCNTNCHANTSGYSCNTTTGNCYPVPSGAQYGTIWQCNSNCTASGGTVVIRTDPATNVTQNSAYLNGELISTGGYNDLGYWYRYREVGQNWQVTSIRSIGIPMQLPAESISNLSANTQYEFFAIAGVRGTGVSRAEGQHRYFTTPGNSATYGYDCITGNCILTFNPNPDYDQDQLGLCTQYCTAGDGWDCNPDGTCSYVSSNASYPDEGVCDTNCTADPDYIEVNTLEPTNIEDTSATLNGEIASTGGHDLFDYFFRYREESSSDWSATGIFDNAHGGPISANIGALEPDTRYCYYAVARVWGETEEHSGEEVCFTTISAPHLEVPILIYPINYEQVEPGNIPFDWTDVSGADIYEVYIECSPNDTYFSNQSSLIVEILEEGECLWRVRACDGVTNITDDPNNPGVLFDGTPDCGEWSEDGYFEVVHGEIIVDIPGAEAIIAFGPCEIPAVFELAILEDDGYIETSLPFVSGDSLSLGTEAILVTIDTPHADWMIETIIGLSGPNPVQFIDDAQSRYDLETPISSEWLWPFTLETSDSNGDLVEVDVEVGVSATDPSIQTPDMINTIITDNATIQRVEVGKYLITPTAISGSETLNMNTGSIFAYAMTRSDDFDDIFSSGSIGGCSLVNQFEFSVVEDDTPEDDPDDPGDDPHDVPDGTTDLISNSSCVTATLVDGKKVLEYKDDDECIDELEFIIYDIGVGETIEGSAGLLRIENFIIDRQDNNTPTINPEFIAPDWCDRDSFTINLHWEDEDDYPTKLVVSIYDESGTSVDEGDFYNFYMYPERYNKEYTWHIEAEDSYGAVAQADGVLEISQVQDDNGVPKHAYPHPYFDWDQSVGSTQFTTGEDDDIKLWFYPEFDVMNIHEVTDPTRIISYQWELTDNKRVWDIRSQQEENGNRDIIKKIIRSNSTYDEDDEDIPAYEKEILEYIYNNGASMLLTVSDEDYTCDVRREVLSSELIWEEHPLNIFNE